MVRAMTLEGTKHALSVTMMQHGFTFRIVSVKHLPELREDIEAFRRAFCFTDEFYSQRLASFAYSPPASFPEATSILLIAAPQPTIEVLFSWHGTVRHLYMPPTYLSYVNNRIEEMIQSILTPAGYHLARTVIPLKPIAVRSMLGAYGRNNICYVPGLGSFVRFAAFFTDLPCEGGTWVQSRTMMARCSSCTACIKRCPTGAIEEGQFLIHAERCLSFLNEGLPDFPSWVDPACHHCIVGCFCCQSVCPENAAHLHFVEQLVSFSETETTLILDRVPFSQLPDSMAEKLLHLDLMDYYSILARNLTVILSKPDLQL